MKDIKIVRHKYDEKRQAVNLTALSEKNDQEINARVAKRKGKDGRTYISVDISVHDGAAKSSKMKMRTRTESYKSEGKKFRSRDHILEMETADGKNSIVMKLDHYFDDEAR